MNFIFASQKYENKFGFQDSTFPLQVLANCSPDASGLQLAVGFPLQSLTQRQPRLKS